MQLAVHGEYYFISIKGDLSESNIYFNICFKKIFPSGSHCMSLSSSQPFHGRTL